MRNILMAAPPAARETGDEATRGREHQEDRERVREREARSARPDQQRARACARDSGPRECYPDPKYSPRGLTMEKLWGPQH